MSDAPAVPAPPVPPAPPAPPAPPPQPPAPSGVAQTLERVWAGGVSFFKNWVSPFFAPVVSLFKMRTWWVYALFAVLTFYMVSIRDELKATLLSSVITLGTCFFGYVIAKIVSPEIKVGETYEAAVKQGNVAASLITVAAIAQRVVYGALCYVGAVYIIPSIADKVR